MTADGIYGQVIWITGLSGVGKSSLALALIERLRTYHVSPIHLDGDQMRVALSSMIESENAYSTRQRVLLARTYSHLAQLLAEQNHIVVVSTISLFHEITEWNRAHLPNYLEVLITATAQDLRSRDSKGLYRRADIGEIDSVIGVDLSAEFPDNSDFIFSQSPSQSLTKKVDQILTRVLCAKEIPLPERTVDRTQ